MDRFLTREHVRLRYRDEGEGAALVLVHGWLLTLQMWLPQVEALAARYRLIRMDRRGYGRSGGVPDLEADARDLAALLDHVGLERVALVGMSQGARVALSLADSDPARVECLVLDGAPADARLGLAGMEEEVPRARYRELLHKRGIEALRRELAAHPFMRLRTQDAHARRLLGRMLSEYRAADLDAPQPTGATVGPPLEQLRLPVLVLTGEHDSAQRRRIADAYCAALPRAERVTVPCAGHLANLDNPQAYTAVLTRFLERHAASRH